MKNVYIINVHSVLDVITNSSTELFICDTDKTVEMVEEILATDPNVYGYQKPWIFHLDEFRKWKKSPDWKSPYSHLDGWFYDTENEQDLEHLRKHYIDNGDTSGGYWCLDRNPFFDRIRKAATENEKHKFDYSAKNIEVNNIYKEFESIEEKPDWWINPLKYYYNNQPIQELDGKIIIIGEGDNSIPYDHFDWIENIFNARRHHLG